MTTETKNKTDQSSNSVQEILQNLANLQFIDSRIDELTRLRGDLPEDILDVETDLARLNARVNRTKAEQKELKLEHSQLETEIKDSEAIVKKYEEQQLTVRNNREYDALTKEIESQNQAVENAKTRIEEIALISDELDKSLVEFEEKQVKTAEVLQEMKDNLDKLVESTKSEEKTLLKKRDKAAKEISSRYLKSYERLREGLNNNIAVVAMEKGSSMGMMLPPQVQVDVRRMNKIIIDENSGRIVVDPSFFTEAKKAFSSK
ncbi:MAG: hypothetical protein WEB89_08750 [Balneolales bacterium]